MDTMSSWEAVKPQLAAKKTTKKIPAFIISAALLWLEHHVVLGPGGGFFEEDFLLLRVAGRTHARGLHGLRCVGVLLQPKLWR